MRIRKSHIVKCNNDVQMRKALALALYCKDALDLHYIKDFTYNKLHELTGIHATTLRKRVRTLLQTGLAFMDGKKLVFKKLRKNNERNNMSFRTDKIRSVKDYEYAIVSLGIAIVQMNKKFVKYVIDKCANPDNLTQLKKAKKIVNRHGYGKEFKDKGISYKYMAKKFHISVCKAVSVVKFAARHKYLKVQKNVERIYAPCVCGTLDKSNSPYTFSTKDYLFLVHANSYSFGCALSLEIPILDKLDVKK